MPFSCRALPLGFRMCLCHLIYTVWPCLIHTWHAMLRPCRSFQGHSTAWPSLGGRAVLWPWKERHGRSMAWAWHGKCESDTATLCQSNGKDKFQTPSGTARNGRETAWARHGNCMLCVWIGLICAVAVHMLAAQTQGCLPGWYLTGVSCQSSLLI